MKELGENEFEARTGRGAVLVDFSAEWCGPCKAMLPILSRISEQYADRLEIFSVDIDKSPALAMRHGVMSVPTFLLFSEGKAVERIVGAVSEKELRKTLDRHVEATSAR